MEAFEAVPKEWGNSLGITIPKEVARKAEITPNKKVKFLIIGTEMSKLKGSFGTLKLKKPINKVMEEIDKGYD